MAFNDTDQCQKLVKARLRATNWAFLLNKPIPSQTNDTLQKLTAK